jgi:hypothetical protein
MSLPNDALRIDPPSPVTAAPDAASGADPDLLLVLILKAVADMALRSKRRQADLQAALRRAGIEAGRARILDVLEILCAQRWVENIVPLLDGGVLLGVTGLGLEVAGRHRTA